MIKYIAHIKENEQGEFVDQGINIDSLADSEKQPVSDHLENTARLAESFAVEPWKTVAYDTGLLHDIGKYQKSFQEKIRGAKIHVDHSTCGAIEASKQVKCPAALIMEYIIAGHHAGLPDGGHRDDQPGDISGGLATLSSRLKSTEFDPYDIYKKEIRLRDIDVNTLGRYLMEDVQCYQRTNPQKMSELFIDEYSYFVRYCYSCLVDADSLDTEHFCRGTERSALRSDFNECLKKLDDQFEQFRKTLNQTELQKTRTELQEQAYQNISADADVYLMNMPTGSGKTLCSAKCALLKAIQNHKKHIIYVIPYNSIITQTAEKFEETFNGSSHYREDQHIANILRHQSTYSIDDDENADDAYKVQVNQAVENWDADFIITTEVQFFETMFSSSRSKLRKMHNMADSVLIFDEAHLIPVEFMQPCLEAIAVLTKKLGSKAILLTATMPDYKSMFEKYSLPGLRVKELVPDHQKFEVFRKCRFHNLGTITEENLLERLGKSPSTLVVVNSRRRARELYEKLGGEDRKGLYHLSTYMTKQDIQTTIDEIRQEVALCDADAGNQEPIIVISTSLIEAGVDLDFCTAYRELTGLDSILQTGGRCNREGRRPTGDVYVFEIDDGSGMQRADKDPKVNVTRSLLKEYSDISDEACIKEYYRRVYLTDSSEMVKNSMAHQMASKGIPVTDRSIPIDSIPFASYDTRMILSRDESLIIPETEEAQKLVEQIRYAGMSRSILRKLQKYTCSVPRKKLEELLEQGVVGNLAECIRTNNKGGGRQKNRLCYLTNMDYYNSRKGILTEGGDYYVN